MSIYVQALVLGAICIIFAFVIIKTKEKKTSVYTLNMLNEDSNLNAFDNKPIDVKDLGPSLAGSIMAETYEKKLDYIKDLIDDFSLEHQGEEKIKRKFYIQLIGKILCVVTNKTCGTCKWHQQEDITKGMVCVNGDSDECANWTDNNFSCHCYEVDEEWNKLYGHKEEK